MASTKKGRWSRLQVLLDLVIQLIDAGLVDTIGKLFSLMRRYGHPVHQGVYEVLEHKMSLELCDPKGRKAVVHKRQRVRFLQDNLIAYQDMARLLSELLCRCNRPNFSFRCAQWPVNRPLCSSSVIYSNGLPSPSLSRAPPAETGSARSSSLTGSSSQGTPIQRSKK